MSATIDIISDFTCPWCFVGKRNLDRLRDERAVTLRWHPYLLHPDLPAGGIERAALIRAKFGSEARAAELGRSVEQAARQAGVDLDLGAIKHVPDTRDAHRLMRWASGQGLADDVAERLFSAHFTEGRNIGDAPTLAELAGDAGLDCDLVAELLAGSADRDVIEAQASRAREVGVSGVPTMILNERLAVVGAQPVSALRAALIQAEQATA